VAIDAMKGKINIRSSVGAGTTVEILLPAAEEGAIKTRELASERPAELAEVGSAVGPTSTTDLVLIDDSRANRLAWSIEAKRMGRSILALSSGEEFLKVASEFDRATPMYVDYFFDGEPQGAAIAERLIQAGFSNVYLATSYPKEKINVPAGVRAVVGKEFPLRLPAGGSTVA
jgi:hypothetical protein